MNISQIVRQAEKFAVDNSPLILTAIGVTGVVTTALLTGKACIKATRLVDFDDAERERNDEGSLPFSGKVKLVWPHFIPPLATAALTVSAIVMSNRIGTRRAAAMAAAYSISEKAFDEYREKVVEKLGKGKERAARDELAQERMDRNPISKNAVLITGTGLVPCYDVYSGRYFESDMESLKKAMNDINYRVNNHDGASVNEFYDKIGLPHIEVGEEMGWNSDELLDIHFATTMTDDQRPAISLEFRAKPVRDYFRTH